jgi:hypothetical protein
MSRANLVCVISCSPHSWFNRSGNFDNGNHLKCYDTCVRCSKANLGGGCVMNWREPGSIAGVCGAVLFVFTIVYVIVTGKPI